MENHLEVANDFINYFEWNENESKIYLPNEIFNDLNTYKLFEGIKINFRHKSFAYSFYYLISYLYRNCKYTAIEPLSKVHSVQLIHLLQCSRKHYSFIVKKEGLLDLIGYTQSYNDFPIECLIESGELIGFKMFNELEQHIKKSMQVPPNFAVKKPLKAFKRDLKSHELDGTFFYFENTHEISFKAFSKCCSVEKHGIEVFYVYAFLKAFNDFLKQKSIVHRSYIYKTLGTNNKKLQYCLQKLEELQLIRVKQSFSFEFEILNME